MDDPKDSKVEGQHSLIKGLNKDMKGLPKILMLMCFDPFMSEGFANHAMPFSKIFHS